MGGLQIDRAEFPVGLRVGDFIQLNDHFTDVFFEVTSVSSPKEGSDRWSISYVRYGKYDSMPDTKWTNVAGCGVRRVIPAEMAVPVMNVKGFIFYALWGQYDPCIGFAPRGTALRNRCEDCVERML